MSIVIEVISKKDCPHCTELKESFSSRGIQYEDHDYQDMLSKKDTERLFILKNKKVTTTPVVLIYKDDWLIDCIEYTKKGLDPILDSINRLKKIAMST